MSCSEAIAYPRSGEVELELQRYRDALVHGAVGGVPEDKTEENCRCVFQLLQSACRMRIALLAGVEA